VQLTRWHAYAAAILIGGGYLAWSIWGGKPAELGQVITAQVAPAVAKEPTKVITARVRVFSDPVKVAERLKIDPPLPHEEIQTAVVVPKLRYGGTQTVFLNTSTGQSRVVTKANVSPWFKPLSDNSIGIGYGIANSGSIAAARYRRDLLQIKAVTLSAEMEGNYSETRTRPIEGRVMGWAEVRF
jgi:hypothetical protein